MLQSTTRNQKLSQQRKVFGRLREVTREKMRATTKPMHEAGRTAGVRQPEERKEKKVEKDGQKRFTYTQRVEASMGDWRERGDLPGDCEQCRPFFQEHLRIARFPTGKIGKSAGNFFKREIANFLALEIAAG